MDLYKFGGELEERLSSLLRGPAQILVLVSLKMRYCMCAVPDCTIGKLAGF
jgi:hypothetical protein